MPRLIAFLRAINVGGRNIAMSELRKHFETLGLREVETFIASGNVLFTTSAKNSRALETKIEKKLHAKLGYEVATFIRSDADVRAIATHKAFPKAQRHAAEALNVGLLHAPLDAVAQKQLQTFANPIDAFHVHDREVYWLCQVKQSDSKFSAARLEKALGRRVTFRGIKTIERLTAKLSDAADD